MTVCISLNCRVIDTLYWSYLLSRLSDVFISLDFLEVLHHMNRAVMKTTAHEVDSVEGAEHHTITNTALNTVSYLLSTLCPITEVVPVSETLGISNKSEIMDNVQHNIRLML